LLGKLIRRTLGRETADTEFALDNATFTLSSDVPRPSDRRTDERALAVLPVGRLVSPEWQDLCKIRNVSAGGMMAEVTTARPAGDAVVVELNSNQQIAGRIVWVRDTTIGIKFDDTVDLREILASRRPRIGFRPRPPRLDIRCSATVQLAGLYHKVEVQDISLGGIKIQMDASKFVGKDVVVTIESLRPVKGTIQWYNEGRAGIIFHQPVTFEELAEWLGKRIDVATLQAGSELRRG
jgi:PilZ domain